MTDEKLPDKVSSRRAAAGKKTSTRARASRHGLYVEPQFGEHFPEFAKDVYLAWLAQGNRSFLEALEAHYHADEDNWELLMSLIESYLHYGRRSEAVTLIGKAVRRILSDSKTEDYTACLPFMKHLRVAEVCRKTDLRDEVVRVCCDVLKKKKDDDWAVKRICMLLAEAYLTLGRYKELVDLLENSVVRENYASFFAFWLLAVAYMRTGESANAIGSYVFAFNYLGNLFDTILEDDSSSVDLGFLECSMVPDCTRELTDMLPVDNGGTSLAIAGYLLGNGMYSETVKCVKAPAVATLTKVFPEMSNLAAEVEYIARARQTVGSGDYETAHRMYSTASSFAPESRRREFRFTAEVLKWDLRLSRVFRGEQRSRTLSELQSRIAGLKEDFEKTWEREYKDRRITRGRTVESFWCIMKHSWVGSLEDILAFKCRSSATSEWRMAQRHFHEARLTTLGKAFSCIEHFYSRFEQLAVQGGYASLESFTVDEQSELLRLLEPGAESGSLMPEAREIDGESLRQLMHAAKQIDEIHKVVKGSEVHPVSRQRDGNRFQELTSIWEITYLGKTISVPKRRGMAYLARLIKDQRKFFDPTGLIHQVTGDAPECPSKAEEHVSQYDGTSKQPDSPLPLATRETVAKVKEDLANTELELSQAGNIGETKVRELEERRELLAKYISEVSTKYGNIRSTTGTRKKSAKSVGKCIESAIGLIESAGLPDLAAHLLASIPHPAGWRIAYAPNPRVNWEVSFHPPQK